MSLSRSTEGSSTSPHREDLPPAREPGRFAVDLANTVRCPACRAGDAFDSESEARRWLRAHGVPLAHGVGDLDLPKLRRVRNDLRDLLEAAVERRPPPGGVLTSLNRSLREGAPIVELSWVGGRYAERRLVGDRPLPTTVAALTAESITELLGSPMRTRLRRCEGPGCAHYLLAQRSSQRWCSPTGCGNRARVQRHYRKVHRGAGRDPR